MKVRLAKSTNFISPQGEGVLLGVPMFFVRLAGCSVSHCPLHPANAGLCDTDWTNHREMTVAELFADISLSMQWLSITGGEPTDQMEVVKAIFEQAHRRGMKVNLQTSGVREVPPIYQPFGDWLTVSPKCESPVDLKQRTGHEMKLVYQGQDRMRLTAFYEQTKFHAYYLMPLWNADGTTNINDVAQVVCKMNAAGVPWRMGIQSHKYAGVE